MKKKKKKWGWVLGIFLVVCILAAIGAPRVARDLQEQSREAIRQKVISCAAQCYAVEGVYPPNLGYLEAHYGLTINHAVYIVSYDAFSSNLLPEVTVLVRGEA